MQFKCISLSKPSRDFISTGSGHFTTVSRRVNDQEPLRIVPPSRIVFHYIRAKRHRANQGRLASKSRSFRACSRHSTAPCILSVTTRLADGPSAIRVRPLLSVGLLQMTRKHLVPVQGELSVLPPVAPDPVQCAQSRPKFNVRSVGSGTVCERVLMSLLPPAVQMAPRTLQARWPFRVMVTSAPRPAGRMSISQRLMCWLPDSRARVFPKQVAVGVSRIPEADCSSKYRGCYQNSNLLNGLAWSSRRMYRICCTVLEKLGSTLSGARYATPDNGSERIRVGWQTSMTQQACLKTGSDCSWSHRRHRHRENR